MPRLIVGTEDSAPIEILPPFVLKTEDNPDGVDGQVFEGIQAAIVQDRYAFCEGFLNTFNNFDVLGGSRIIDRAWQASFNVAVGASSFASYACVSSRLTDFRADLRKLDVPVLLLEFVAGKTPPVAA
jgi:non-heme chloroperoxidase